MTRPAKLPDSQELFQALFDSEAAGIMLLDPLGIILRVNGKLLDMLGYSREEMLDRPALDFAHPDDKALCVEAFTTLRDGQADSFRLEQRGIRKNHEILWIELVSRGVYDPGGSLSGYISVISDITERKQQEEALLRSEWEKRLVLDAIYDHVLFLDANHRVLWANKAVGKDLGLDQRKLIGKRCYDLWHQRQTPCDHCPVTEAMETGKVREGESRTPDGEEWSIRGYPALDEQGRVIGCVEVIRNITESKKSEQVLMRAKEAAEQANEAKSEFLMNMSHELRTPLNGVLGMLDVLLDTDLDEEQQDCVQTSLQAGEGLLAIINDILDYSKLQAEQISLAPHQFDLRETVRTVLETFGEEYRRKGLKLTWDLDPAIPETLVADEGRLRQILFNLLGNAIKFTPKGQVDLKVWCLGGDKGLGPHRMLFRVSDTGLGIPDDKVNAIFEPFTQLDWGKSRKYEGTGLGLGIVKRLVALLGGGLAVDSQVDRGTRVYFLIRAELD